MTIPSSPLRPLPRSVTMRLLPRSLSALATPIACAVALLATAPSAAHASSIFTTFTDRAQYLAQVSASAYTNSSVDIGAASDPSSIGGVGVSTTGGVMELGAFGGSPALVLYPTEAGNTFSFAPGSDARGFGLSFLGADTPAAATVTISFVDPFTPSEDTADDGTPSAGQTVRYTLGGGNTGFFGVVLRGGIFPSAISQVAVTTTAFPTVVTSIDLAGPATTVPEPATVALMATGLLALAGTTAARRRRGTD